MLKNILGAIIILWNGASEASCPTGSTCMQDLLGTSYKAKLHYSYFCINNTSVALCGSFKDDAVDYKKDHYVYGEVDKKFCKEPAGILGNPQCRKKRSEAVRSPTPPPQQ